MKRRTRKNPQMRFDEKSRKWVDIADDKGTTHKRMVLRLSDTFHDELDKRGNPYGKSRTIQESTAAQVVLRGPQSEKTDKKFISEVFKKRGADLIGGPGKGFSDWKVVRQFKPGDSLRTYVFTPKPSAITRVHKEIRMLKKNPSGRRGLKTDWFEIYEGLDQISTPVPGALMMTVEELKDGNARNVSEGEVAYNMKDLEVIEQYTDDPNDLKAVQNAREAFLKLAKRRRWKHPLLVRPAKKNISRRRHRRAAESATGMKLLASKRYDQASKRKDKYMQDESSTDFAYYAGAQTAHTEAAAGKEWPSRKDMEIEQQFVNRLEQEDKGRGLAKKNAPQLLPVGPNDKWDAQAARKRLRSWATNKKTKKIDYRKYGRAFLYAGPGADHKLSAYKLPIADVFKTKSGLRIYAIPHAIIAAGAALDGAREKMKISPAAKTKAKRMVAAYYKKMGKVAPWDHKARKNPSSSLKGFAQGKKGRAKKNPEKENTRDFAIPASFRNRHSKMSEPELQSMVNGIARLTLGSAMEEFSDVMDRLRKASRYFGRRRNQEPGAWDQATYEGILNNIESGKQDLERFLWNWDKKWKSWGKS